MKTINKIKKRIKTIEQITGKLVEEVQITKEESEQIGNISSIDRVKIIVVDKLGEKTKRNCFAYNEKIKDCEILDKLYCKNEECKFYKTNINKKEIENSIKKYALKHS